MAAVLSGARLNLVCCRYLVTISAITMQYLVISSVVLAVLATAVRSNSEETVDTSNRTSDENPLCFVKTVQNNRVIAVTSIGQLLREDAARFERGRIWRRPSRLRTSRIRGDSHGRGSASLLAALCSICRKQNKTRCLRQFCSVRGRLARNIIYEVECTRM